MNHRKKITVGITGFLLTVAVCGLAFAGQGQQKRHRAGFGGMIGPRIFKTLRAIDLTPEQDKIAVKMRNELRNKRKAVKKENQAQAKEVLRELKKPTPDAKRLHALAAARMRQRQEMMHTSIDRFLSLHATMSDAQRAEFVLRLTQQHDRTRRWE